MFSFRVGSVLPYLSCVFLQNPCPWRKWRYYKSLSSPFDTIQLCLLSFWIVIDEICINTDLHYILLLISACTARISTFLTIHSRLFELSYFSYCYRWHLRVLDFHVTKHGKTGIIAYQSIHVTDLYVFWNWFLYQNLSASVSMSWLRCFGAQLQKPFVAPRIAVSFCPDERTIPDTDNHSTSYLLNCTLLGAYCVRLLVPVTNIAKHVNSTFADVLFFSILILRVSNFGFSSDREHVSMHSHFENLRGTSRTLTLYPRVYSRILSISIRCSCRPSSTLSTTTLPLLHPMNPHSHLRFVTKIKITQTKERMKENEEWRERKSWKTNMVWTRRLREKESERRWRMEEIL